MSTVQIAGLLTNQLNTLTSTQWAQVSTADVLSLTTAQIAGIASSSLNMLNACLLYTSDAADE